VNSKLQSDYVGDHFGGTFLDIFGGEAAYCIENLGLA
jgi:hypothetical protein